MSLKGVLALGAALAACRCAPAVPEAAWSPEPFVRASAGLPAGDCRITQRTTLTVGGRGVPVVSAQINGGAATMVLDTGAERSVLTEEAAQRLHVTGRYDFIRTMRGIEKEVRVGDARLQSVVLGGVNVPYPRILVGNVQIAMRDGLARDGLLGSDLLGEFDLDLDLPHSRVTLYDRTECPNLHPPLPGPTTVLAATGTISQRPLFPVRIEGRTLSAAFDSGAQRTVLTPEGARRLGVSPDALAGDLAATTKGASGEIVRAAMHQFHDFRIGNDRLQSPVLIAPIALPRDVDVLVGLDYLAFHRVWLSYGSRRLFIGSE